MLKFNAKALLKMAMKTDCEEILLVGDQGVYFMPRTKGAPPKGTIIYAKGIDPKKDAFEDWWATKRELCGGDDFFQPFSTQEIRRIAAHAKKWVVVTMTEEEIQITTED